MATLAGTPINYSTNDVNQYTMEAMFAPTYDADGNATSLQNATGTWAIAYNGANRATTWQKSTGEKVFMMYDALGRRFEKRVLNAAGTRILRERYVYVGYDCVQVLNGDNGNAVMKEFVWEPTELVGTDFAGTRSPLAFKFVSRGLNLFYAVDGNKNVSDLFFFALQNGVALHYEYSPFGLLAGTSKSTTSTVDFLAENPFRFSSQFFDTELDLIYYNYRHYSPLLGRFLSRDPIGEQGGVNLYAFCGNDPINKTDKLGMAAPAVAAVIVGEAALVAAAAIMGVSLLECLANIDCLKLAVEYTKEGIDSATIASKITACEAAYWKYKTPQCGKCTQNTSRLEDIFNCACWKDVYFWRQVYLSMRCDYFLPGSIKEGSEKQEAGHKEQLDNVKRAKEKCCNYACKKK